MNEPIMPDYVDALEQRLRRAAASPSGDLAPSPPPRHRWAARVAAPAMACVALAGTVLIFAAAGDDRTPRAYGKPPILRTAPVEAAQVIRALTDSGTAKSAFAGDVRLTEVRLVTGFGQAKSYLVTGPSGWCLTLPNPESNENPPVDPLKSGGVTCIPTNLVYKYGISGVNGGNLAAALPEFAKHPTLKSPDGTIKELEPSDQGVVVATDVEPGSVLTLYAEDGTPVPSDRPG